MMSGNEGSRSSRLGPVVWLVGLSLLASLAASCSSLRYYGQSLAGGARILGKREPIERLLERQTVSLELRRRLELVLEILDFAHRELLLPDNGSYRTFVEIEGPFVVWNVVAAPELSLEPRIWCFPVAGCVAYRGYFSEQSARKYATKLEQRGWDVAVQGVTAYSTLGWFRDPVLSTFFSRSEPELAALFFHELAHQQAYVKGDTTFNESFATVVEEEGVRRWLESRGELDVLGSWREAEERERQFVELVLEARQRLSEVYAASLPGADKRRQKQRLIEGMKEDYEELRSSWGGAGAYDGWFELELNNAHFASIGSYRDDVAAFAELLRRQGGDLQRFYSAVAELAAEGADERAARLAELAGKTAEEADP